MSHLDHHACVCFWEVLGCFIMAFASPSTHPLNGQLLCLFQAIYNLFEYRFQSWTQYIRCCHIQRPKPFGFSVQYRWPEPRKPHLALFAALAHCLACLNLLVVATSGFLSWGNLLNLIPSTLLSTGQPRLRDQALTTSIFFSKSTLVIWHHQRQASTLAYALC